MVVSRFASRKTRSANRGSATSNIINKLKSGGNSRPQQCERCDQRRPEPKGEGKQTQNFDLIKLSLVRHDGLKVSK